MTAAHVVHAAIFDMDGLLVDTEPLWQDAEIEVMNAIGVPVTREDCRRVMGLRTDEVVELWHGRWRWAAPEPGAVVDAIIDRLIELVETKATLMTGVVEAIERLQARGAPLALASSSKYRIIDAVLDRFDLRAYFPCIHSAEEEVYGKPHPAVYLTAAAKLGVDPPACLALEDSINGLVAAKAARMRCVMVPDPSLAGDPRLGLADLVLPSLDALDDGALTSLGV